MCVMNFAAREGTEEGSMYYEWDGIESNPRDGGRERDNKGGYCAAEKILCDRKRN